VKPGAIIFNAFFGPCVPGKSVDIVVEPHVEIKANDPLPLHEVTQSIPFACDKHTHQGEIAVPLKNNNLTATITFKFEITSNCK
jgi:hypothetical protein